MKFLVNVGLSQFFKRGFKTKSKNKDIMNYHLKNLKHRWNYQVVGRILLVGVLLMDLFQWVF